MKIIKTTLPGTSLLYCNIEKYDYVDSFQGTLVDNRNIIKPADVGKAFFSSAPAWVERLLRLRTK